MTVREVYLESAAVTSVFLGHPALAACWEAPSALARLRVGALAAHLPGQVTQVPPVLDAAVVDACVPLAEHWGRSSWTDGDLDSEVNTYIRRAAGEAAGGGAGGVLGGGGPVAAAAGGRAGRAGDPAAVGAVGADPGRLSDHAAGRAGRALRRPGGEPRRGTAPTAAGLRSASSASWPRGGTGRPL